jgi:DNA polymerase-4
MFPTGRRGTMRDRQLGDSAGKERVVLHVDMDAFYAQVEQLHRPELRGIPLIVGLGDSRRGVVATCSYEARAFGVRSGMPIGEALRLCPQATVVAGSFDAYEYYAEKIRDIFREFTPLVEPTSIDEAYLDVTKSLSIYRDGVTVAGELKRRIKEMLSLICSVGVSVNKHLAKVASALEKPDGLTTMWPEELPSKFFVLDVSKLFGVGPVTTQHLNEIGIFKVGQLAEAPLPLLTRRFGVMGEHFRRIANGLDDSPVKPHDDLPHERSMSHEHTFEYDINDFELIDSVILYLTDKVVQRLKKRQFVARTITLRVRYADFKTITRDKTISRPTDDVHTIFRIARSLLPEKEAKERTIRLLGVRVSKLTEIDDDDQISLFVNENSARQRIAANVVEQIRSKFGKSSIARAGSLHYIERREQKKA